MKRLLLALLLCLPAQAQDVAFFQRLKALDGQRFTGRMVYPSDKPEHEMAGKPMTLEFKVISDAEIRVPFQVGEDRSRTWVIRLTPQGLSLKHDHRLPDGAPDPHNLYGGWALPGGVAGARMFPADAETAAMIPAAASNCWMLELAPDGRSLTYYLERDFQPRFQALFTRVP